MAAMMDDDAKIASEIDEIARIAAENLLRRSQVTQAARWAADNGVEARKRDESESEFVDRVRACQQEKGVAETLELFREIGARSASGPQAPEGHDVPPGTAGDDSKDVETTE